MLVIYPAFLEFKEIMIILVVAVVIFGPKKIPEIARGLGQAVRKMKEATEDIKQEIMNPVADIDPTKEIRETIADLDPTKDIQDAFKSADPTQDITKALEDPINDLEKSILDQENTTKEVVEDKVKQVQETIEIAKTEIEIKTEQELGNGGSISR
ncbi:Sec-independent protein translocase subunit TatA/TatB [Faecalibacter bovis]|uniref:Sec-independent protein translocase protein TatA n=1 Tax=Faecalibacter bovis TaxID=2898187 RepID=A0ABX7XC29_9FLAO|nr:twin-arginine translocase TatA/TatE family subunit [Faecalibacter bovis]MBS7333411.1 twin-arginine translocase TatA/TatE family subunit [Weeksellaceae bacterium]QTV05374.1 twin-arginine translocase TatA/TatE family subunit [Faecalibacter bovis]